MPNNLDRKIAEPVVGVERLLTDEQQIIREKAAVARESMKIKALAGTGKTTMLYEISEATKQLALIYLAFTRSDAQAAQRKFRRHVKATTAHAFAYEAVGYRYRHRLEKSGMAIREAILDRFRRDLVRVSYNTQGAIGATLATLNAYLASAADRVMVGHLPASAQAEFRAPEVIQLVQRVFDAMADETGDFPVTHDTYLKLWQLSRPRLECDLLMFDESQDANAVMLDIVNRQTHVQRIFVGDENQSIYGFRHAINALEAVTLPAYPLTQSWRFGPAIARIANLILEAKDETLRVRGRPDRNDSIESVDVPDAVLARTNAGLFEEALAIIPKLGAEDRIAFVGGVEAVLQMVLAAHELWKHGKTSHPEFKFFKTWKALIDMAESGLGGGHRPYVKLVEKFGSDIPDRCADIAEVAIESLERARVVFSTAHKFKGKERPRVRVAGDFPAFCDFNYKTRRWEFSVEEANLAYVTVTRAEHVLDLGSYKPVLERSLINRRNKIVGPVRNHLAGSSQSPVQGAPRVPAARGG